MSLLQGQRPQSQSFFDVTAEVFVPNSYTEETLALGVFVPKTRVSSM